MRVCMVNDCAHVGEDLANCINSMNGDIEVTLIRGSRRFFGKTFGALWKIAKLRNYDLYHVHYALQHAYLVDKLKHLDILHVHGSDVRWTINSKKWGWIVRRNLKKAKVVLYATSDLKEHVLKFREDAIYLPTPVKTDVFTPKQDYGNPLKAVYFKLPYEKLPLGLDIYLKQNNIALDVLERNVPYEEMPETLRKYDIFIDRFSIPSFSKTCLEAMASGLATINYRHHENILGRVDELTDIKRIKREGIENRLFIEQNHDAKLVAGQLSRIWRDDYG